jgi:exopolysaccharide biosynthesis WecB/TagA/CpsF family protein
MYILGVRIDPVTPTEAMTTIFEHIKSGQKCPIFTVNTEFIVRAQIDEHFKATLNRSALSLADGVGVIWAANFLNQPLHSKNKPLRSMEALFKAVACGLEVMVRPHAAHSSIPERITGVDFSYHICKEFARTGKKVFLLGEKSGVAEKARQRLIQLFPRLLVSGFFSGNGSPTGDLEARGVIRRSPADLVLVAYGAPKQEQWIERNLADIPVTAAIGVGGTLLYMSGLVRRAPKLWRRFGLEWLYRLITEPWRWKRQLALPRFIRMVVAYKINDQA